MPPRHQLAKTALVLLFKLALLSLIAPFLVISSILFMSPFLRLGFNWPPFLFACTVLLGCCAPISWRQRDWGPIVMGLATIATAGVMYLHLPAMPGRGVEWVLSALSIPAAISFLYRNRITEPLLVFPALIVLGFAFTDILCPIALLLWAHVSAGYPLGMKDVWSTLRSLGMLMGVAPIALLYWLGKHGYAPWLRRLQVLLQRRRA